MRSFRRVEIGGKSWVELKDALPIEDATPVLDGEQMSGMLGELDRLLAR